MNTVDVVSLTIVDVVGVKQKMYGRNDIAIAASLKVVSQAMQNQPNTGGNDKFRHLGKFQRKNLPTFKGRCNPDEAQTWLGEIERIFRVVDFYEARKVRFGTHIVTEEADDWWITTSQVLDVAIEVVTWAMFNIEFLRKYFPEDVRGKKEIEFLELKHGNLLVTEYAAKFGEHFMFYPHYGEATSSHPYELENMPLSLQRNI